MPVRVIHCSPSVTKQYSPQARGCHQPSKTCASDLHPLECLVLQLGNSKLKSLKSSFIPLPQTASGERGGETRGLHTISCVLPMDFPTSFTVGCAALGQRQCRTKAAVPTAPNLALKSELLVCSQCWRLGEIWAGLESYPLRCGAILSILRLVISAQVTRHLLFIPHCPPSACTCTPAR